MPSIDQCERLEIYSTETTKKVLNFLFKTVVLKLDWPKWLQAQTLLAHILETWSITFENLKRT